MVAQVKSYELWSRYLYWPTRTDRCTLRGVVNGIFIEGVNPIIVTPESIYEYVDGIGYVGGGSSNGSASWVRQSAETRIVLAGAGPEWHACPRHQDTRARGWTIYLSEGAGMTPAEFTELWESMECRCNFKSTDSGKIFYCANPTKEGALCPRLQCWNKKVWATPLT